MRNLLLLLVVALLAGCETTQQSTNATTTKAAPAGKQSPNSISKQAPTGIVFNTSDVLYTGGLGPSGVDGFCKRIGDQVAQKFSAIGITGVTNAPPTADQARLTVQISTIESKSGVGFNPWWGVGQSQKVRVRYSAQLDSPTGGTLATWKHEVEEDSVDRLTDHIASDIVKYLKKGFK